jgi:hypothetical protein
MSSYSTFVVGAESFDCYKAPEDGKPHLAKKVIYDGIQVSYVTDAGKMFSTRAPSGRWYFGSRWGGRINLVRDAIALGVISKGATVALVKAEEARRATAKIAEAARDILNSKEAAGLTLTASQVKALKRKAKAR